MELISVLACGTAGEALTPGELALILLWLVPIVPFALARLVPQGDRLRRVWMELSFLAALAISTLVTVVRWGEASESLLGVLLVAPVLLTRAGVRALIFRLSTR